MAIEVRQTTDVPCTLIDLNNQLTVKVIFQVVWLLHGEPQVPITEEHLIETIKLLVSDGVFDDTQNDLLYWYVGLCLGVMSGKTIPQVEGEEHE